MELAMLAAGAVLVLAAATWKIWVLRLDRAQREAQLEDLLAISDSLNRTEGRRARKILWRDKTVGDLVREMRAIDSEKAG